MNRLLLSPARTLSMALLTLCTPALAISTPTSSTQDPALKVDMASSILGDNLDGVLNTLTKQQLINSSLVASNDTAGYKNQPSLFTNSQLIDRTDFDTEHGFDSIVGHSDAKSNNARSDNDTLSRLTLLASGSKKFRQNGRASWYGGKFHGRKTASGERFNMHSMTAAHKSLPFNTYLRVTNKKNGKSVVVKVNDRGPYAGNRVLDLSYGAAKKIGLVRRGVGNVTIERVSAP